MINIYTCKSFLYYREMPVIRVPLVPRGLRAVQELQVWPDPKETGAIEETPVWWVFKAKKEKWAPKVSIFNVFFLIFCMIVLCIVQRNGLKIKPITSIKVTPVWWVTKGSRDSWGFLVQTDHPESWEGRAKPEHRACREQKEKWDKGWVDKRLLSHNEWLVLLFGWWLDSRKQYLNFCLRSCLKYLLNTLNYYTYNL